MQLETKPEHCKISIKRMMYCTRPLSCGFLTMGYVSILLLIYGFREILRGRGRANLKRRLHLYKIMELDYPFMEKQTFEKKKKKAS